MTHKIDVLIYIYINSTYHNFFLDIKVSKNFSDLVLKLLTQLGTACDCRANITTMGNKIKNCNGCCQRTFLLARS